jgi:hypothetical protein
MNKRYNICFTEKRKRERMKKYSKKEGLKLDKRYKSKHLRS